MPESNEGVQSKINVAEVNKQTRDWVDKEMLTFLNDANAAIPEKLGRMPLKHEDRIVLETVQDIVNEIRKKPPTDGKTVSTRRIIFDRLGGEALTRFDTMMEEAKSTSTHFELYNSLTPEQQATFPEGQKDAADVFARFLNGDEFTDIALSNGEKELIGAINVIRGIPENKGKKMSELLDQYQMLVYQNFIQRLAYRFSAGELREESVDTKEQLSAPKKEHLPVTESKENLRTSEQEGIGDLNGSYESFKEHLLSRGLVEDTGTELVWKGGNKRVTFVGDILGDRDTTGMKVVTEIKKLNEAAQKEGGSVEFLAGNHDNYFNAFLGGFDIEGVASNAPGQEEMFSKYPGMLETVSFAGDEFKKEVVLPRFESAYEDARLALQTTIDKQEKFLAKFPPKDPAPFLAYIEDVKKELIELDYIKANLSIENEEVFMMSLKYLKAYDQEQIGRALINAREKLLSNMKASPKGKEFLEGLVNQKLTTAHDDVLYTHTNLTIQMTQEIVKGETAKDGAEAINELYQKGLRFYLMGEGTLTPDEDKKFHELRKMFLTTGNSGTHKSRTNFTEDDRLSATDKNKLKEELKAKGVAIAVHGHNFEDGAIKGDPDLPIISIDQNVYKGSESRGKNKPIASITVDRKGNAQNLSTSQMMRKAA